MKFNRGNKKMSKDDCHDIKAIVWKFLMRRIPKDRQFISNTCLIADAIDNIIETFARQFPDTTVEVCAELMECLSTFKITKEEILKAWYGEAAE